MPLSQAFYSGFQPFAAQRRTPQIVIVLPS